MNIVLWVLQVLLALLFLMAGIMKSTQPKEKLAERMSWVNHTSPEAVKAIGVLEILGGVGLVLPALTGILPWLTPLAATGLALTMIGAVITHVRLNETAKSVAPIVLLILSAVVAYGRFVIAPL